MIRRKYPTKGRCRISMTTPVVALIETGCGVATFLDHLLQGRLDTGGRTHRFDTLDDRRWSRGEDGKAPPEDVPRMQGDVTWRTDRSLWSLDVGKVRIADDITWEEQIAGGRSDGCLTVPGLLPQSMICAHTGKGMKGLVQSPIFDEGCTIEHIIHWPGAPPSSFNAGRNDMTRIYVNCMRREYDA
jgi:hypothetical protein